MASWWRSNSNLTKGNNTHLWLACIYSFRDKVEGGRGAAMDEGWLYAWGANDKHHRGRFKMCFQVFLRFSIFYSCSSSYTLSLHLHAAADVVFFSEGDAIWYLKLLSLLVMFVKFFICKQRSRWYLRQSAIWVFGSLFSVFFFLLVATDAALVVGACSLLPLSSSATLKMMIKSEKRRKDALTATFDNLTILCHCSSVKVLWL